MKRNGFSRTAAPLPTDNFMKNEERKLRTENEALIRQVDLLRQQLEIAQIKLDEWELRTKRRRVAASERQRRYVNSKREVEAERKQNRLNGVVKDGE